MESKRTLKVSQRDKQFVVNRDKKKSDVNKKDLKWQGLNLRQKRDFSDEISIE